MSSFDKLTNNDKQDALLQISKNVEISNTGCEVWKGNLNKKNYPVLRLGKLLFQVSTLLYRLVYSEDSIELTEKIVRTCDNALCVAESHLVKVPKKATFDANQARDIISHMGTELENGCRVLEKAYMNISIMGQNMSAHKFAYLLHTGLEELQPSQAEDRLVIRHLCNDARCINPEHLKFGTQFENDYEDKIDNGTLKRGSDHYNASITEDLAKQIKLSKGNGSQKERATRHKVSINIVKDIDRGKTWGHLFNDGKTRSKRAIKARQDRKAAKARSWTAEMYEKAASTLQQRSKEDTIINKFTGSACHIWQGKKNKQGYGHVTMFGHKFPVHILACEVKEKRRRAEKEYTRHLCGQASFCNPDHLKFGTPQENTQDSLEQGTYARAKLTVEQVKKIKIALRDDPDICMAQLSVLYKVNKTTIKSINSGKTWKSVSI